MSSDRYEEPGADLALYGNARCHYCGNRGTNLDFLHEPIILDDVSTAQLLSAFESCQRAGHWSRFWRKRKYSPIGLLTEAVNHGLTAPSEDPGESAGEECVTLASNPGMEVEDSRNIYRTVMNQAAIADLIVTAMRSKWETLPPIPPWQPSCFTADGYLRRFLPVQHWSEDREQFERRSWFCLGEVAHYKMPMQLAVAVVGHMNAGRRAGHFSRGLLHPSRSHLRFKRKFGDFKESWTRVYREDHSELTREKWLQGMLDDGVLQESLFVVNIPVPSEAQCKEITDLAKRQIERLYEIKELPEKQLSTCFDPISRCAFVSCCHGEPESEPERGEFKRI
jgi:hypothetical protein